MAFLGLSPSLAPKKPDTIGFLEPNYSDVFNTWKAEPNPKNTSLILNKINPIIDEAMRSYASSRIDSPTMRSKAKKLAISALQAYDPMKSKLKTHLLTQFQGLRRMAAKEEQMVSVPEQVMLDLGHLVKHENNLRNDLNRDPSDAELAEHSGLSIKRINYLRGVKPSYAEGKMTTVGEEGSGLYQPTVVNADATKNMLKAWQDFVYHDLEPIDQVIMEHSLGLHNKPVLDNHTIAKKLNLSPGAISQRKAKIQELLDDYKLTGLFE